MPWAAYSIAQRDMTGSVIVVELDGGARALATEIWSFRPPEADLPDSDIFAFDRVIGRMITDLVLHELWQGIGVKDDPVQASRNIFRMYTAHLLTRMGYPFKLALRSVSSAWEGN